MQMFKKGQRIDVDAIEHEVESLIRSERDAEQATRTEDRFGRISAASHIARALQWSGARTLADMATLAAALDSRAQLFARTASALHECEKQIANNPYWRITPPSDEDGLLFSLAGGSWDSAQSIRTELAREGSNVFVLLALAFQNVAARQPELFGRMTHEEEARQHEAAFERLQTSQAALAAFREELASLAERLTAVMAQAV